MASMWPSTVLRFAPIVHDRYVAPPSLAPCRNIARPLVVPATVLLDGLEAECIGIPSELEQLSHNPRLDLDRLGLSPARKKESVPDPSRPVERGLAETSLARLGLGASRATPPQCDPGAASPVRSF